MHYVLQSVYKLNLPPIPHLPIARLLFLGSDNRLPRRARFHSIRVAQTPSLSLALSRSLSLSLVYAYACATHRTTDYILYTRTRVHVRGTHVNARGGNSLSCPCRARALHKATQLLLSASCVCVWVYGWCLPSNGDTYGTFRANFARWKVATGWWLNRKM